MRLSMSASDLLKLVGSNVVTLIVAWMVFTNTADNNENNLLKIVLERVEILEQRNEQLQAKVMVLGIEAVELKAQLSDNVTRKDLYQAFLDGLPFPAWIKRRGEDGVFRMIMINNSYVNTFGVSKARYEGNTDEDIWGEEIARGFKKADDEVFATKGYVLTRELIPQRGPDTKAAWSRVWKFSIKLGESNYGVGGVVVIDFIDGRHELNKNSGQ